MKKLSSILQLIQETKKYATPSSSWVREGFTHQTVGRLIHAKSLVPKTMRSCCNGSLDTIPMLWKQKLRLLIRIGGGRGGEEREGLARSTDEAAARSSARARVAGYVRAVQCLIVTEATGQVSARDTGSKFDIGAWCRVERGSRARLWPPAATKNTEASPA